MRRAIEHPRRVVVAPQMVMDAVHVLARSKESDDAEQSHKQMEPAKQSEHERC